jgi:hypothetical protein
MAPAELRGFSTQGAGHARGELREPGMVQHVDEIGYGDAGRGRGHPHRELVAEAARGGFAEPRKPQMLT